MDHTLRENAINWFSCRAILQLLDDCYKWGVQDAAESQNRALCEGYINKYREPGVFGRVIYGYTVDWREWTLTLNHQARVHSYSGPMSKYFNLMGRFGVNYLSTFIVAAQEIYIQGLIDYNNKPDRAKVPAFMDRPKVKWDYRIMPWHARIMIEDVQMMLYKRLHLEEELGYKPKLKRKQYLNFISSLSISYEQSLLKR